MNRAKITKTKATLNGEFLIIDSIKYTADKIHLIPTKFNPSQYATMEQNNIILFHGCDSALSNFHPACFSVAGTTYNDSEMYYQSKKAEYLKDSYSASKILKAKDPNECLRFGSKVKGFDPDKWETVEQQIMLDGCIAKFTQKKP